jgi:hypothetical protein
MNSAGNLKPWQLRKSFIVFKSSIIQSLNIFGAGGGLLFWISKIGKDWNLFGNYLNEPGPLVNTPAPTPVTWLRHSSHNRATHHLADVVGPGPTPSPNGLASSLSSARTPRGELPIHFTSSLTLSHYRSAHSCHRRLCSLSVATTAFFRCRPSCASVPPSPPRPLAPRFGPSHRPMKPGSTVHQPLLLSRGAHHRRLSCCFQDVLLGAPVLPNPMSVSCDHL